MTVTNPGYWLRPWTLADASFVIKLRNDPEYMQYFRQDKPISLSEQREYMKRNPNYDGYILMYRGKKVGVFALHGSELCVVSPLEHIAMGVKALCVLNPNVMVFGQVFTHNPALPIYLNCGFEAIDVKEKAYKKQGDWVSTITICRKF